MPEEDFRDADCVGRRDAGRFLPLSGFRGGGEEIVVTKDGVEVGRFVPKDAVVSYLTD